MLFLSRFLPTLLAVLLIQTSGFAGDEGKASATEGLVPFASAEGLNRLSRTQAKADFAALANQFEAQATIAFCGPTSAAIVLNAMDPEGKNAPDDRSRLLPSDARYLAANRALTARRYTQESVIGTGKKTRAQVFGEPVEINGKLSRDGGYQLRQLNQLLEAHQIKTRMVIADSHTSDAEIRKDLIDNLSQADDFVLVNYFRPAVGQAGGGHISPLAAYDPTSDSVLVLDVNPSQHPWVWMPLRTLIQGMRTRDNIENRGYILTSTPEGARVSAPR